jgi:hypothetical protein
LKFVFSYRRNYMGFLKSDKFSVLYFNYLKQIACYVRHLLNIKWCPTFYTYLQIFTCLDTSQNTSYYFLWWRHAVSYEEETEILNFVKRKCLLQRVKKLQFSRCLFIFWVANKLSNFTVMPVMKTNFNYVKSHNSHINGKGFMWAGLAWQTQWNQVLIE